MRERTLTWEKNVRLIRKTPGKYSQERYNTVDLGCVHGSGKDDLGNLFELYFFWKDKILLTHCRRAKYNFVPEIWTRTPESSDISK